MGQINVTDGGVIIATNFANNQAAADYIKANGAGMESQIAAYKAGSVPAPPATSSSTLDGAAVPQQTGSSNPPVGLAQLSSAPVSTSSPNTSGGTDPSSAYAVAPTSKGEQKAATNGDTTVDVAGTFPTVGFVSPQIQESLDLLMADFYRNGKTSVQDGVLVQEIQPKSIDPWDGVTASIRVFGFRPKGGAAGTANDGQDVDHELVPAYTKFILESVTEQHNERSQIVETFGDFYVFLFGERPPMYQFSGTLINTRNVNWVSDFKFYYDNFLRGTKCVESSARLLLTYGGRQIEGFMLGMTTATDASLEAGVKVSFPVVVTRKTFLGFSDDFGSLVVGGNVMKDDTFIKKLDQIAGKTGKGTSEKGASDAAGAAQSAVNGGNAVVPVGKSVAS